MAYYISRIVCPRNWLIFLSQNIIFWAPSCLIVQIFEWKLDNWPKDKQDCMSISWIVNCLSLRGTALPCSVLSALQLSKFQNCDWGIKSIEITIFCDSHGLGLQNLASIKSSWLFLFFLLHDCRLLWMTLCRRQKSFASKLENPSDSCIFVFCSSRGTSSAQCWVMH